MVELRLTVVDEEKQPLANAQIELYYGSERQHSQRFKTGANGVGVAKIPFAAANPETQGSISGTDQGMANRFSLWEIPKDWNPSKPLEMTVTIYKRTRVFTGTVVDSGDKPVAGALVGSSFDFPLLCAKTDHQGRFKHYDFENPIESLFAFKDGVGGVAISPDFEEQDKWKAMNPEGREEWKQQEKHNNGPFTLKLAKGEPISVRVVNSEGNPVEGILVAPTSFSTDYRYTKETQSWNAWHLTQFWGKKTDANGMVRFDSIPTEGYGMVCFDAFGDDPRVVQESKTNQFGKGDAVWRKHENNNDLVISLPRRILVKGSVRNADGTPPSSSMQIIVTGLPGWSDCGTCTDYAGNFTIFVNANEVISVQPIFNPQSDPKTGVAKAKLSVPVGNGRMPAPRFDFVLEKGTKVLGKITAKDANLDVSNVYLQVSLQVYDDAAGTGVMADMNHLFVLAGISKEGEYETRLPDGRFRLKTYRMIDGKVDEKEIAQLIINGEDEIRFDLEI
jgi:uncharacterized GH25 family protein